MPFSQILHKSCEVLVGDCFAEHPVCHRGIEVEEVYLDSLRFQGLPLASACGGQVKNGHKSVLCFFLIRNEWPEGKAWGVWSEQMSDPVSL